MLKFNFLSTHPSILPVQTWWFYGNILQASVFASVLITTSTGCSFSNYFLFLPVFPFTVQYGIKKKEEKEAEAAAAMEQASEGSLTRPKKAVPAGCGDEEEEESIVDTVMKFIPAPLMDMFNKK